MFRGSTLAGSLKKKSHWMILSIAVWLQAFRSASFAKDGSVAVSSASVIQKKVQELSINVVIMRSENDKKWR